MNLRALCLTLFAFAALAPSANAAVADRIIPLYDASDGVHAVRSSTGEVRLRFGPKAAKLYKSVAGKRANVGCGTVTPEPIGDGPFTSSGFSLYPGVKLAKRRGTVRMWTGNDRTELCYIATQETKTDRACFRHDSESKLCLRVLVAMSPSGKAYIEAKARTIELSLTIGAVGIAETPGVKLPGATRLEKIQALLGPDVVELATADDTPPAGKVGYWSDTKNVTVAVLRADGTRGFLRVQDGVYSTNDMDLTGLNNDEVFRLF